MSRKIDVRRILDEKINGLSNNEIARQWRISKHSVGHVVRKGVELGILPEGSVPDADDNSLYKQFFPDKADMDEIHAPVNFDYVHKELNRTGVTLKLLWKEYNADCICSGKVAMSYHKFCRRYSAYYSSRGFADHIIHKAGDRIEVDWPGPTMHYTSPATGKSVTVYLFVSDLVSSRLAYVEPTLLMDEKNRLQCHVNMWKYYGGVSRLLVCDNLLTGVKHHPREGEIILTREYERLVEHYGTAIMPCQQRKPRQKNSAENTVYNIALSIIAKLRNIEFRSFSEIRKAVEEKLEELNNEPFEKRLGSRRSDFEENERKMLRLLPAIPYKVGTLVWGRKVQPSCHVSYTRNWYSVPFRLLGRSVDLRITTRELQVFKKDRLVKRHVLLSPDVVNHYSTDPSDMPNGAGFVEWDSDRIMRCACSIGTSTAIVIERILASRAVVEQSFNNALAILRMTKRYNKDDVEKASEEALGQFASPRYHHLKAILASEAVKMENTSDDASSGNLNGSDYFKNFGGSEND